MGLITGGGQMTMSNWLASANLKAERSWVEHMALCVYPRHTKMETIIVDGWGHGFYPEQTLHECVASGFSMCIAEPAIKRIWAAWDAEYRATCEQHGGPCEVQGFVSQFRTDG